MKTDRFSDIIRRKLESIRPEFTEKDWVRMQATLHQAGMPQPGHTPTGHPFSGGVWSGGQSWLLAAASVSTVALIGVGIWQRNQISDLRQTVAQLKQKVVVTQPAPSLTQSPTVARSNRESVSGQSTEPLAASTSSTRSESTAPHRDTVYIDRYTTAPVAPYSERTLPKTEREERLRSRSNPSITQNYAAIDRTLSPTGSPRHQNELPVSPQTNSYGVNSTPLTNNQPTSTQPHQPVNANQSDYQPSQLERVKNKSVRTRSEQYASAAQPTKTGRSEPSQSTNEPSTQNTVQPVSTDQPDAKVAVSASYESMASLPLTPQTINWNALLAQQAKRNMSSVKVVVSPLPTVAKVETKLPVNKPEKRIEHTAIRFRAGLGGEVDSHLLGAGLFTETLLGKHWLVGVGINQTAYNGRFINEDDFQYHTHHDLPMDPGQKNDKSIISNIDAQTNRLQIPLYLGYRIPLTASIAFLPTAGTYLNLTNTENITYYLQTFYQPGFFLRPQIISRKGEINNSRPVELINSFAFGTGIEWQQKHWVLQGSPVLTVPLQASMKPMQSESSWQQNITLGFRARLLYQF